MEWWVENFKGKEHPLDAFYWDGYVQSKYREWLSYLANRVNTYSGYQYKSDPTIFAWDTANEPHTKDGADKTGEIVAKWVCDISRYMKEELGIQQMVTSGEEGYMTDGADWPIYKNHEWIQNGQKVWIIDNINIHLYYKVKASLI